jgi:predicted Zn-dependent protease
MRAKIVFVLLFICACLVTSCSTLKSGDNAITPEQEYYVGRAAAANILSSYPLWEGDPRFVNYLNLICNAIVINSSRPNLYNGYHVAVLDSSEIKAFATPGGHILLTLGLVSAVKGEDALAAIIAHEVAHIQLQHAIKEVKMGFPETVDKVVLTLKNGYSTEQEYRADNLAMHLMADAGYYPSMYIEMLREIKSPDERIANAKKSVDKIKVADTRAHRQIRYGQVVR